MSVPASSPSQNLGRAVLALKGKQARQSGVNYTGTGVGTPAPAAAPQKPGPSAAPDQFGGKPPPGAMGTPNATPPPLQSGPSNYRPPAGQGPGQGTIPPPAMPAPLPTLTQGSVPQDSRHRPFGMSDLEWQTGNPGYEVTTGAEPNRPTWGQRHPAGGPSGGGPRGGTPGPNAGQAPGEMTTETQQRLRDIAARATGARHTQAAPDAPRVLGAASPTGQQQGVLADQGAMGPKDREYKINGTTVWSTGEGGFQDDWNAWGPNGSEYRAGGAWEGGPDPGRAGTASDLTYDMVKTFVDPAVSAAQSASDAINRGQQEYADKYGVQDTIDDLGSIADSARGWADPARSAEASRAARDQLSYDVSSQRDAGIRQLLDMQNRGGRVGGSDYASVYSDADKSIAEGSRKLTQDDFNRQLEAARYGNQAAMDALGAQYGITRDMFETPRDYFEALLQFIPELFDAAVPL